jgi:hypothetical protein
MTAAFSKTCRDNLRILAKAYAGARKISLAAVSKEVYGKSTFIDEFVRGDVSISIKNYSEMVDTITARWPSGTKWPLLKVIVFGVPKQKKKKVPNKHTDPSCDASDKSSKPDASCPSDSKTTTSKRSQRS